MNDKEKLIKNTEIIKKGLNLLGRNRKTVLSHHKTFELTDELEAKGGRDACLPKRRKKWIVRRIL